MKVKELLDSPDKWTKGAFARTVTGDQRFPNNKHASCWCLYGAILKCCENQDSNEVYSKVSDYIQNTLGIHTPPCINALVSFNDREETTFEDIKQLITELDI